MGLEHTTEKISCNIWTGSPVANLFKRTSLWFPFTISCSKITNRLLFSDIWQVAGCPVSYSNLSSKVYVHICSGCHKMDSSLSCSTPFIAISSCSSCHLYLPLCTYFSGFWFQIKFELIFQFNLNLFVLLPISLVFNIIFQTLESILENIECMENTF